MNPIYQREQDSWAAHDAVRHFMYLAFEDVFRSQPWEDRQYHLMEFGCREPTSPTIRILGSILDQRFLPQSTEYPAIDLLHTPYGDNEWDITVADQVLEHTDDPWACARELYRITKQGGVSVVATPFLHPIHPNPIDCWRIAPDGYRRLFPESKWEYLTLDMWGTREIVLDFYNSDESRGMTKEWIRYERAYEHLPHYGPGNDGLHPILIWWIGRKR